MSRKNSTAVAWQALGGAAVAAFVGMGTAHAVVGAPMRLAGPVGGARYRAVLAARRKALLTWRCDTQLFDKQPRCCGSV